MRVRWGIAAAVAAFGLLAATAQADYRDAAGDKKREMLAAVKRLVVVPPFFATETLDKVYGPDRLAPVKKPRNPDSKDAPDEAPDKQAKVDPRLREYAEILRTLEVRDSVRLPERAAARLPFQIVPREELTKAYETLDLSPPKLFLNKGRILKGKFPQPDVKAVAKLAELLHADAVLLGTLDEPRRNNGGVFFDPFAGLSYDFPDVRAKGGFYLMMADGREVHHAFIEALHPMTKRGDGKFITADWTETEYLVLENLMDEISRYAPAPSAQSPK